MRTIEEEAECRRSEAEFEAMRVKVCAQVEAQAKAGCDWALLSVADVRQLLHALSIRPYRAMTLEEATAELRARKKR